MYVCMWIMVSARISDADNASAGDLRITWTTGSSNPNDCCWMPRYDDAI